MAAAPVEDQTLTQDYDDQGGDAQGDEGKTTGEGETEALPVKNGKPACSDKAAGSAPSKKGNKAKAAATPPAATGSGPSKQTKKATPVATKRPAGAMNKQQLAAAAAGKDETNVMKRPAAAGNTGAAVTTPAKKGVSKLDAVLKQALQQQQQKDHEKDNEDDEEDQDEEMEGGEEEEVTQLC